MTIQIIDNLHSLFPSVKRLGRRHANTLGFMPDGGFDDYGKKQWIFIAYDNNDLYGYLLFRESPRYNKISIVHLCVDSQSRGSGIAKSLLQHLVDKYKQTAYSTIELWCRDDYKDASKLWSDFGFTADFDKRSKSIEEHALIHWKYILKEQISLFDPSNYSSELINVLLDTNIILRLRDNNTSSSLDNPYVLFSDSVRPLIECFVSGETYNETLRDLKDSRARETRRLLRNFHHLTTQSEKITIRSAELKKYITGNRVNDESDRRHVATCIECGIPYLLSFDEPLIKKSNIIEDNYGVKIMHPTQFVIELDSILNKEEYNPVAIQGSISDTISKIDATQLSDFVTKFWAQQLNEDKRSFKATLYEIIQSTNGIVKTISHENDAIAIIGSITTMEKLFLPIIRVENSKQGKYLFMNLMSDHITTASRNSIPQIVVKDRYLSTIQKSILSQMGFIKTSEGYVKYIHSAIVAKHEINSFLLDNLHLSLNDISGLTTFEIETLFFPLKIRDADIPSYIIPVKPIWAKELFDSIEASQSIFGANTHKLWNIENVYYRNERPNIEKSGARILWYVSNDKTSIRKKGIVACSYLYDCVVGTAKELYDKFKHYGVYSWHDLMKFCDNNPCKKIKALRFSHTELFDNVVSLSEIREVIKRCGGRENITFQSPLEIASDVFFQIYERRSHDK